MQKGQYKIPRKAGWEEVLEPLIRRITGAQQADVRAGCFYDSPHFTMHPHYLGKYCPCEYGQKLREFDANHTHTSQCFHTNWLEIDKAFKDHPKYTSCNKLKVERINMVRELCNRNTIPYNPKTVSTLCTCPHKTIWENMNIQHSEECLAVSPNLWIKNGDIKIWWYRFFFRDAVSNKQLDLSQFQYLIASCLDYVNKNPISSLV